MRSVGIPRAFTLIELLIVVAIIAILAAIAVPNFLEAQTRAKVTRSKADMRTLSVATESYRIDNNRYPVCADEQGHPINPYPTSRSAAGAPGIFETRVSARLTTPVAYLTTRMAEPFPGSSDAEDPQYHYSSTDYAYAVEGGAGVGEFLEYSALLTGRELASVQYLLLSHGPDLDHDGPGDHHEGKAAAKDEHGEGDSALYDPTNGTVSNGDILFLGPGVGFPN